MNCLYMTLFFNIFAGVVQTFIVLEPASASPSHRSLPPTLYTTSWLDLAPHHCHLTFSQQDVYLGEETWKSLGARSGLYGGWSNISYLNFSRSTLLTCAEWGRVLSWSRPMLYDSIPLLLFWMACWSRVKVSGYAAALIVVPGGMKLTRRMPFLIFFTEI